ncbi:unnamed protein product [Cylindrotheca closterium]|uniref:Uncharacterized protein n=1 Tax=Cylindrotheca closterium TaxID=2856 RepID=A0AAD2FZA6_9STRA|nr:unnamed protein product [Cylindrotheca closterium]CAJ1958054.1 unnamed protein product [Cylindrotheca closterium]CAJ1958056.1 unnamed protein product [Cylindrotheca closterium]
MRAPSINSVLGEKLLDDSYPDGRVYCWAALPHGLIAKEAKVKISNDQKKVYLLMETSSITTNSIMGRTTLGKNNIHKMLLNKVLQEAKEQSAKEMEKISDDIAMPPGYRAECLFHLPYRVHRYFIDAEGERSKKIYFSPTSMRFWLQKSDTTAYCSAATPDDTMPDAPDPMQVDPKQVNTSEKKGLDPQIAEQIKAEAKKWKN